MSQTIWVSRVAERSDYPILIGESLFDSAQWLPKKKISQIVIITDHHVKKLYGLRLQEHLSAAGHLTSLCSFPAGEKSKTYKTKQVIEEVLHTHHCDRDTLIVALGGGVVGDLAGFISATFLRGVPYIQLPTTLLAMVDSSIGGKTGINTPYGKNLIGCIYQPLSVIIDTQFIKTLATAHLINGLIECIKMFLTHDVKSFHYVEAHLEQFIQRNESVLNNIIIRAVRVKTEVITRDEKDSAERNTLNFGHTIGHALEKLSNYDLLHGYAVAYGILVEAMISHLLGLLDMKQVVVIKNLMAYLNIFAADLKKYDVDQLIKSTKTDKKIRSGNVNYVLLKEIGCVYVAHQNFVHAVPDHIVKQAFNKMIGE